MTTTTTKTKTTIAAAWTATPPARYRTEKSVSYERWSFEAPSKVFRTPP